MYRFMQICGHITCTLIELEMTPWSEKGTTLKGYFQLEEPQV